MRLKLNAMKQQLWKYQQKDAEMKDKEEELLVKEENLKHVEKVCGLESLCILTVYSLCNKKFLNT